jgi:hypothetical protein
MLRGTETIGERFERDRLALLPLPASSYEACQKQMARVSSLSLVRYRANNYSVPTAYGHREVLVKGSCSSCNEREAPMYNSPLQIIFVSEGLNNG